MSDKVVNLSQFKEKKLAEGSITIELDDGAAPVVVPPPQLWSDEVYAMAKDNDNAGACALVLGADEYGRFCAAGGSSAVLLSIIADTHGISLGK